MSHWFTTLNYGTIRSLCGGCVCVCVIPRLRRLRQEDLYEFQVRLCHIMRS